MMNRCVNCGAFRNKCICDSCASTIDLKKLCMDIINYDMVNGTNSLWNDIIASMDEGTYFKNIVTDLVCGLETPYREYVLIELEAMNRDYVRKEKRQWLYDVSESIRDVYGLRSFERNRILGLLMNAYVSDFRFSDAEELSSILSEYDVLPRWCYYTLGEFYIKTRRYESAEEVLMDGLLAYKDNEYAVTKIRGLLEDNESRRPDGEGSKKEYLPSKKEDKLKYCEFMASLGIDVDIPQPKVPTPIRKENYPNVVVRTNSEFDSFVAYDFETTGFSPKTNCIIEIGAVKVINGVVSENQEFIFKEFVKPYKSSVSRKITEVTGITPEDVKDAREMWQVTPDFMEFVGDFPMVGFNNVSFDSKFLQRAGRYSQIVITNEQFDVMTYARELNLNVPNYKLGTLADYLGIVNPQAHRAWDDAITTARVFLKLKENYN